MNDNENIKRVCGRKLCEPALEIINRQKEMLKGWEESFCELSKIATPSVNYLTHAKFNIIKEFVRQQKEIMRSFLDDNNDFVMKWSEYEANTDNLVRKITGGYNE